MSDTPESGELLGIPYNFERPSLGRMLSAYWQPGEGILVEKPFGVGYTLNLANWRSWLVVGLLRAASLPQEGGGGEAGHHAPVAGVGDEVPSRDGR